MRARWLTGLSVGIAVMWLEAGPSVWARSLERSKADQTGIAQEGATRMECADIIREVDRRRQPVDPNAVGHALDQSALWVQRCMQSYGRRVGKPAPVHVEIKEEEEQAWENTEAQEVGEEETRDAREPQRRPTHEERQRRPTPDPLDQIDR